VLLTPGSFGSHIFRKEARAVGDAGNTAFGETATLPHAVRKRGPRHVMVWTYATRLPTGFFPEADTSRALAIATAAYPAITLCEDPLAAALLNAGPIMHPPLVLMNAGPIEHFDAWDIHQEGTQPSIMGVINALDAERICVREALGYGAPHYPIADHYAGRGEWMYGVIDYAKFAESGDWREHIDINTHRYMREDIAIGLSLLSSLARKLEVDAPLANAFVSIASAVTGRDLFEEGRTLERLGHAGVSAQRLRKLLHSPEHR
jgi:opine dehydrogenase